MLTHPQPRRPSVASRATRSLRAAAPIALAGLVLGGCVEETSRFVEAPEAVLGEALEGELAAGSPANLNDGARYSAHWLCGGEPEGIVRYALDAPFRANLALFDEQGDLLGASARQAAGESAPAALLESRPDACTLLVVSGADAQAFGPYRLEAETGQSSAADEEPLALDRPLYGRFGDARVINRRLSLDKPMHLALTLEDGSGTAGLQIIGEGLDRVADTCGGHRLSLDAYLMAGDYRVSLQPRRAPAGVAEAASCPEALVADGDFYRLTADATLLPDGVRNGGPLSDGDAITGRLDAGRSNDYRLHLEAPSEVVLGLVSEDFDALLGVVGPQIDVQDDDSGGDTDARLTTVLMPGDYHVEVKSYEGNGGRYRLSMSRSDLAGELRNTGALSPGETVMGALGSMGDNRYTFEVEALAEVSVALNSSSFDPTLRLVGDDVEMNDDDSGGNRNALIRTVLQPGRYVLEVASYEGAGAYTLALEQQPFEGELRDGGRLVPGDLVYGRVPQGDAARYQLEVASAGQVRVETSSAGLDTLLSLRGPGVSREDDDGGVGAGSRIDEYLSPGTYAIEVRDFGGNGGLVRLEVGR